MENINLKEYPFRASIKYGFVCVNCGKPQKDKLVYCPYCKAKEKDSLR